MQKGVPDGRLCLLRYPDISIRYVLLKKDARNNDRSNWIHGVLQGRIARRDQTSTKMGGAKRGQNV